jgi:hypothetical protein
LSNLLIVFPLPGARLVDIYEHLGGAYSIIQKKRVLGRYNAEGKLIGLNKNSVLQSSRKVSLYKIPYGQNKEGHGKIPRPSVKQLQTGQLEMLLT